MNEIIGRDTFGSTRSPRDPWPTKSIAVAHSQEIELLRSRIRELGAGREPGAGVTGRHAMLHADEWKANDGEQSHFEDAPELEICRHPSHNPPSHMLIPHGKVYVRICPACRVKLVIRGSQATL